MAKIKFDGLIEAVRYAPDGNIDVVRAYERRGATFSDHILIDRASLVERLNKGEKFVTGLRKEFLGSTFNSAKIVRLVGNIITTGNKTNQDLLEEVPIL
jgi:hypothetical protein